MGDRTLCANDPIATLVICENRVFLAVGETVDLQSDGKPVELLSADFLAEPSVNVRFQVLNLCAVDSMDDDWEWNKTRGGTYSTLGRLVEPLDPTVLVREAGKPTFVFKSNDLRALALALYDKLSKADIVQVPKVKRTDHHACFVCEKDTRETTDTLNERFCPACPTSFELDWNNGPRVLEHMATHMLFDRSIDRATEPCGFCLRPQPMCVFFTRKGKGKDSGLQVDLKKSHGCERCVPFQYKSASTCSTHSPCSNVPIVCPRCPSGSPAVWKYNFLAHLQRAHPTANVDDYKSLYSISGSETAGLRTLWDSRYVARRASRTSGPAPLKISEEHRALLVVPYVALYFMHHRAELTIIQKGRCGWHSTSI
ncbi:hypothetical protein EXIGLDRAFT_606097 [Exidia glandulosa HHB12029]|uniref:Uncharacterized protein n=1 Tax=Exidia glandulosa HHB12029 TaxID=1314781 RepID=A0A165ME68_EXIGL|nr:hypothetical protein EXIGLDRAFT_606097 [Exidia glandulosa HHB12029]